MRGGLRSEREVNSGNGFHCLLVVDILLLRTPDSGEDVVRVGDMKEREKASLGMRWEGSREEAVLRPAPLHEFVTSLRYILVPTATNCVLHCWVPWFFAPDPDSRREYR